MSHTYQQFFFSQLESKTTTLLNKCWLLWSIPTRFIVRSLQVPKKKCGRILFCSFSFRLFNETKTDQAVTKCAICSFYTMLIKGAAILDCELGYSPDSFDFPNWNSGLKGCFWWSKRSWIQKIQGPAYKGTHHFPPFQPCESPNKASVLASC